MPGRGAVRVRAKADGRLWVHIERIYQASGGTYGSPRIHAALKAQGSGVGKKRVERSMRKHGLRARSAKLYHANPGSHAFFASIPNRQLDVIADRADRVWVGDITYLKVGGSGGIWQLSSTSIRVGSSVGVSAETKMWL